MRKQNWRMQGLALLVVLFAQMAWAADNLPNIKILATGGTIAGAAAVNTETVSYKSAVFPVDTLINNVPELKKIANVSGEQISQIGSQDMNNEIWLKLAKRINQLLATNDVDGIVITHGTDTMEETAYFLSLVVKSDKPVVLVGSMRPATAMSADGPLNLYNAMIVAGSKEARGKGVLVVMNDMIFAGRDVTKTNTFKTDTFKSVELGALGYVQGGKANFYKLSTRKHGTQTPFDVSGLTQLPRVDIFYGYANASRVYVDAAVKAGVKGIVHAGVGDGNLYHEVEEGLIDAQKQGLVIVRSSRVGNGIVARNGEVDDDKDNFVVSDNLNPQKARVLLMLALTKTSDPKEIQNIFWEY
ncbi:MAG: type II asparaginase [Candidatus Korobacteraceae bacterium]|jgi:L-asparaginase